MENESKRYFTSRIIKDLDALIRSATSIQERNILFAKKACSLARYSFISEAKTLIRDLRQANKDYEPRLSAWIMFAEGIIEHVDTFNFQKSKDRIYRSHLVGQAANDPSLAATSAAWLAHFEFVQGKYEKSKEFLDIAFSWSTEKDSEARSRAAMVLGLGFHFVGDTAKARFWLEIARGHAITGGDIAMQNIIFYNSCAVHAAQLTLVDCTDNVDAIDLKFAVMSSQSAENLNTALGISNQSAFSPVQRAELLIIQRNWSAAIEIFNSHIDAFISDGQSNWSPKFHAQRAWCNANIHDYDSARKDIEKAMEGRESCLDPDDQCVLHFRIAGSARLMNDIDIAAHHEHLGQELLTLHNQHRLQVEKYFGEVSEKQIKH